MGSNQRVEGLSKSHLINIAKDTSITLITGNSKGFRSQETGTVVEDQTSMTNIFWSL